MAEFEEKYTPKSVADALMDMKDVSDVFFDKCENLITKFKLQKKINDWYSVADASKCTAEEFKRTSWRAMLAIVMEE